MNIRINQRAKYPAQPRSIASGPASRASAAALLIALPMALMACGGGGSSSSTPVVPAASLSLTGTAATGAAIGSGAVEAKCAAGTGTATTAADGNYTITITGGALPCALRVTAGTTVLHGVATGSGSSARANLTPVTELAVARLTGGLASAYFTGFNSITAGSLTSTAVQTAVTALIDTLKAGGVDFSASGDVMAGTLVAANGSTAGNAYDKALDALKATLTSTGTTLATLAQTVASTSPSAPAAVLSNTASLPADLLLKPKAANCDALRSGKYRVVINESGGTAPSTQTVTVDAVALTVTNPSNEVFALTATGTCAYTTAAGGEVVVSSAGVITARVSTTGAALKGAVLFPEQTHTVAELAGDWNVMEYSYDDATKSVRANSQTLTLDATGKPTASLYCGDLRTCIAGTLPTTPAFTANPAGGYNLNGSLRAFAYRAGGGELMLVYLSASGDIGFATRKVASTLPPVGRIAESWNLTLTASYTAPSAIGVSKYTVASLDTAAGSFVRNQVQNFTTGSTRPETLVLNYLRDGYGRRLPATSVMHTDGSTSTVSEFISMSLRGMDMAVVYLVTTNQFLISPTKSIVNP